MIIAILLGIAGILCMIGATICFFLIIDDSNSSESLDRIQHQLPFCLLFAFLFWFFSWLIA